MWKYLPLLASLTASCATYEEQAATSKPTVEYYTSKPAKDVTNCIKARWIHLTTIADVETDKEVKVYIHGGGGGATITETDKGTHVVAHIKSASWAVIPKKLAAGAENCK